MRSLFPRIFVSFWAAMTLVGAASVIIHATTQPSDRGRRIRNRLTDAGQRVAADALDAEERGADADAVLAQFRQDTDIAVYIVASDRTYGDPPAEARELAREALEGQARTRDVEGGMLTATVLERPQRPVVVARLRGSSPWARAVGASTLHWRVLVIFLLSGLVSLLLARYLTRPRRALRRATQRFAEGDLAVRVTPELAHADAEIAALGADFDRMATRVEELVVAQRRLLTDVSHELNSPLARLRVALELARQRAGEVAAGPLDRIEREAERLSVLIGEILTVTRLEQSANPSLAPVDLGALIEEIARDADFEAKSRQKGVVAHTEDGIVVTADEEMVRRAIENVVRNAIRFAPEGTSVEIAMRREGEHAVVRVRDHGPGVPEHALKDIFLPLYRVDRDRDRKTGGTGLGLAIAERAVKVHGGTIDAENADGGGLLVTLRLPV
jgi:two-component system sensor histidine kinase CpxA